MRQRRELALAGCWAAARVALAAFVLLSAYLLRIDPGLRSRDVGRWLLERLTWWDTWHAPVGGVSTRSGIEKHRRTARP